MTTVHEHIGLSVLTTPHRMRVSFRLGVKCDGVSDHPFVCFSPKTSRELETTPTKDA